MIFTVCIIALLSAIMVMPAAATTWTVCSAGCDFTGIAAATVGNAALADGDMVFVYNGSYSDTGSVVPIWKLITLKGEGADVVTWDGGGYSLELHGAGTIIEGLKFVNSDKGVSPVADCIIRNCVFEGLTSVYALQLALDNTTFENNVVTGSTFNCLNVGENGNFCTIDNNTLINNPFSTTSKSGIYIKGKNCTVSNNTIANNTGRGIGLSSKSANATITKNNISSNYLGLKVFTAEGSKIYLNNICDNTAGNVEYGTTPPTVIYWNSTEQIKYVYGSTEYTNYLGNYWAGDYGGTDGNGDGIGDTDYPIPGSGTDKDYRPLMAGYENYPEVEAGPGPAPMPNITGYAPSSPVSDAEGAARAFNITVNQTVNVSWRINGTEVQTNESVTEASYTNTSAATGTWNVSAIASNANGTDMRQWDWIVTAAAEPPYLVTYTISNRTITPPQTTEIDVEFSEEVEAWISIEDSDRNPVNELYHSPAVTNPTTPKTWNGTYENDTVVPAGDYYVNVTGTSTTTGLSVVNNTEVITVVITEPDLTPTAITTPANIFATQSNGINATIANTGSGDVGAFDVSLSAEGDVVDRTGVAGLDAGNSKEVSFEWTPAASGTYELCVVADCDGVIDESDETNNVTCRSVYAVQPGNVVYFVPEDSSASYCNSVDIDLMAEVNEATAIIAADVDIVFNGDCVEIANWVGNSTIWQGGTTFSYPGDQPTPPYRKVKISSSMGSYYPPIPGLNGTLHIGTLTLHCNCTEYCETGLDFTYAHYSNATGYASAEPAAQNGTFTCENAPDLVVRSKSEEWINMVSKTYKVHYTVKNEGNANAGVSNVSLTVDGVEKETKQVSALAHGAEESGTFDTTLTMSDDSDVIVVCADCNDDVFEFNEGNNCMENEWTAALKVDIGDYVVTPGGIVKAPVTVYGIQNYGTGTISVAFDKTVAQVTKVESSSDSTVAGSTIDNSAGIVSISAWNLSGTSGTSGGVIFAYVTFKAVGTSGSSTALDLTVSSLKDISNMDIPTYTDSGSLAIREDAPPVVSDTTATPGTILNDNGRARVPGTNVSELSVHVADTAGVASVTVNLTPIRGPGNDNVPMTRTAGDDQSGIWSLNVTATYDAGVDQMHCLAVNATDVSGNSNTDKCILLTVLRRGDVNVGLAHDNVVDMGDALYIARYTVGKEPAPDPFVADVVGAGGAADSYNGVDMGDALYIARKTVGKEVEP